MSLTTPFSLRQTAVFQQPVTVHSLKYRSAQMARQPSLWKEVKYITSISDWVTFELSGILSYEPSQAAETLLFDVRKKARLFPYVKQQCFSSL